MDTHTQFRGRTQKRWKEGRQEKVQRPRDRKGLDRGGHDGKMALRWRDNVL